jgi:CMP/dCMP kinase
VVAVDGPSGAGKTTLTRLLSQRLRYVHIDTGAMFRAVALTALEAGIDPDDETALATLCGEIDLTFRRTNGCCHVIVNGRDVSDEIRTPEISMLTSRISAKKIVRDLLLELQRRLGRDGGVVLEGRDIGTVVFPDAEVKFFLSATPEERGRRRFLELQAKGDEITLDQTIEQVVRRDEQDAAREHAPLRKADDAVAIDSTGLSVDEVLDLMERTVRERVSAVQETERKGNAA